MNTSVSIIKPDIFSTQLEANAAIEAANKYLPATLPMVVMDPYEAEALMRFNATVFFIGCHLRQILLMTQHLYLTL